MLYRQYRASQDHYPLAAACASVNWPDGLFDALLEDCDALGNPSPDC
jgi:hypothetical protein